MVTYVDLFCGIGSFHYSFERRGWTCVMACDINESARKTYKTNYGLEPLGDIVMIEPNTVQKMDVICAGFPCQPFSNIGQHKGLDDDRGSMFAQVMKFAKYHHPKVIILENVPGLAKHDKGTTFQKMLTQLQEEGYTPYTTTLTCSDYGIPQMRKRLFVIAVRGTESVSFNFHKCKTTLSDYLNKHFEKDTAYTIRCGGRNSPIGDKHNWDGYIVDGKPYRLTIGDARKLQGFPDNFHLEGSMANQWRQLGNTIPTVLTDLMAQAISPLFYFHN